MLEDATLAARGPCSRTPLIGSLSVGKKADLIVLDTRRAHLVPAGRILSAWIHNGQPSDMESSMVDGQFIMRDRKVLTIDEERIVAEADKVGRRILDAGARGRCDFHSGPAALTLTPIIIIRGSGWFRCRRQRLERSSFKQRGETEAPDRRDSTCAKRNDRLDPGRSRYSHASISETPNGPIRMPTWRSRAAVEPGISSSSVGSVDRIWMVYLTPATRSAITTSAAPAILSWTARRRSAGRDGCNVRFSTAAIVRASGVGR